jgi:hypothetical protein
LPLPPEIARVIEMMLDHQSLVLQDAVALPLGIFRSKPTLGFSGAMISPSAGSNVTILNGRSSSYLCECQHAREQTPRDDKASGPDRFFHTR